MTNAEMFHAETAAWLENKRREYEDLKRRLRFYDGELSKLAREVEASTKLATVESPKGYRIILDPPAKVETGAEWLASQAAFQAFVGGEVK